MSQALYRKWRPARFDEIVGQEHVTRTLMNSVAADRLSHAYLFCGPRGTGKTTTARLVAKAVNCLHQDPAQRPCDECTVCKAVNQGRFLDLIEIDAASNTGVDDIRDLRDKINFSPSQGRMKVYIIDEVHMLSAAAFNALLKTLEEPPAHAMFVLATTEEHKVPLTIKSRCQQFNFRLLTDAEITSRLLWLSEKEALKLEPEAVALIARQGAGSLRDAESLLDQLITAPGDTITLERAQMVLGTATDSAVISLTDAWLDGSGAAGLSIIHKALASGTDARQFCRQMVVYLRELLLLQAAGTAIELDGPVERSTEMLAQANRAPRHLLIESVKRFSEAAMTPTGSWQPQLPLELAFIGMLPETAVPVPVKVAAQAAPSKLPDSSPGKSKPAAAPVPAAVHEPAATGQEAAEERPADPDSPPLAAAEAVQPVEAGVERPASGDLLSLQTIASVWPELVTQLGSRNKNLPALLNMGKPLAIEGETLVLGFDYPIFKEKFDNTEGAKRLMAEGLSALLSRECLVRSVVTSDYSIVVSKDDFNDLARELGGVVRDE